MTYLCRYALAAFALAVTIAVAQDDVSSTIGTLRQTPDAQRGAKTKEIALQIRALPAGQNKANLALSLAFLSTEGDFGMDALQAVADTLANALAETPQPEAQGQPSMAYMELAELERYEGVNVELADPEYKKARAALDRIDQARAKADFSLAGIDGKTYKLSALRGKVVLVNFWATWCPPCRKEMPDLNALYKRFENKGLVIVAISNEDASKVRPFIEQNRYTYPIALDPGNKTSEAYHVDGIPKTFIYDRQGRLVAQAMDMRTRTQFLRLLAKAGLE